MYADDIILLSPTLSGLQKLADLSVSYSNRNGIALNSDKTEILVSGNCSGDTFLMMDSFRITPVDNIKHLGFLWNVGNRPKCTTLEDENLTHRINKMWTKWPVTLEQCDRVYNYLVFTILHSLIVF